MDDSFHRPQHFCAPLQQQRAVRPSQFHQNFGLFQVLSTGRRRRIYGDTVFQLERAVGDDTLQQRVYFFG